MLYFTVEFPPRSFARLEGETSWRRGLCNIIYGYYTVFLCLLRYVCGINGVNDNKSFVLNALM